MLTEEKKELIKQEKVNLVVEKSHINYSFSRFTISLEMKQD